MRDTPDYLKHKESLMGNLTAGLIAGFAASAPMAAAAEIMHSKLPRQEQYPLPPREIMEAAVDKARIQKRIPQAWDEESERIAATYIAHSAYAAATGALFGIVEDRMPCPAVAKGVGFGLAVWSTSYLGILPGLRLLKPATRHPWRRNALMIVSHVIWGGFMGAVYGALTCAEGRPDSDRDISGAQHLQQLRQL